jgi:serine protease AprX
MRLPILLLAVALLAGTITAFALIASSSAATSEAGSALVSVIVQRDPAAGNGPDRAVVALGGRITAALSIINGFAALVPADAVDDLETTPGVAAVTPDSKLTLSSSSVNPASAFSSTRTDSPGWKSGSDFASMSEVTKLVGAQSLWASGITGKGVGIALIDSGVVPVDGLRNQVVFGPDLSFESQAPALRNLDAFGHGTHLAGIMAGSDGASSVKGQSADSNSFSGIAPAAKIISLKVATYDGATDVSQVLAAIDWVVEHRNDRDMNIRVLCLAFGTDSPQDYRIDPLAYAAEVAWRKGIVVVVAAGNEGDSGRLNDPAVDPYVIAVGAEDMNGTPGAGDDLVPEWSSEGSADRGPDVVAPGRSVVSLRSPGSWADLLFPEARVGDRYFRGSGTSQAPPSAAP